MKMFQQRLRRFLRFLRMFLRTFQRMFLLRLFRRYLRTFLKAFQRMFLMRFLRRFLRTFQRMFQRTFLMRFLRRQREARLVKVSTSSPAETALIWSSRMRVREACCWTAQRHKKMLVLRRSQRSLVLLQHLKVP